MGNNKDPGRILSNRIKTGTVFGIKPSQVLTLENIWSQNENQMEVI